MRHALFAALIPLALAGCLLEKEKEKSEEESIPSLSEWGGTVQDFFPLVTIQPDRLFPDPDKCNGGWAGTRSIPYRIHGDTLDLRWSYIVWPVASEDDSPAGPDTFLIAGTYTRSTVGEGVRGGWKLIDYRAWNSGTVLDSAKQAVLAEWNFLYLGEEAYIGDNILALAYPRLWISKLRMAEYAVREDDAVAFQYVGKDSLRITRDGETVGMRYKPFQYLRASSSSITRDPLDVALTDTCFSAGEVVDTTWIHDVVWGITGKRAASGKISGLSELAFKHR